MGKYLSLIFLLSISGQSFAKKITLNDLISKVESKEQNIDLTYPKPFIKEISLRLDDDQEFKRGDIDVEARFMIDNLSEFNLKRKLYANQKKRKEIIQKINLGDNLNQIINHYISLALYRKKYQLLKNMNTLFQDKVKVYNRLVKKGRAEAIEYLSAIEKRDENQQAMQDHLVQIKAIVSAINSMTGEDYKIQDFDPDEKLVSVKYIESKIKNTDMSEDALSVKLSKYNLEKMKIERKLEVEADNKILDFIGVGFNQSQLPGSEEYDEDNIDRQRLSIKVGLLVPFLNSNMKRADNTIESFLKKRKARVDRSEAESNMVLLQGEVQNLTRRVKKMENSNALKEAKRYLRIYSRRKGTSPIKILDINTYLIESEIKLNEYRSALYVKFYQYMYEIGKLKFINGRLEITS